MKAKLRADIDCTRQKDKELHARLQSKMPKREPSTEDSIVSSVKEGVWRNTPMSCMRLIRLS